MDAASPSASLTASGPSLSPEEREPGIDWALLHKLALGQRIRPDVSADGLLFDPKPKKGEVGPRCKACGVKYPGAVVCGYCRDRIAELRRIRTTQMAAVKADLRTRRTT